MSLRNNLISTSALLLVALCGASSPVTAADTKPIVRETCTQATLVDYRSVGHPGKSMHLPKRQARAVVPCSRDEGKPMILASYTDARGGQALVNGRTQKALEQLSVRRSKPYTVLELNNQCVAYTVLRQWPDAKGACDAAVASARVPSGRFLATAYSNRAVMHWLSNDELAAHNDLAKARKLAPRAAYVLRNLNVTAPSSLAVAQAAR